MPAKALTHTDGTAGIGTRPDTDEIEGQERLASALPRLTFGARIPI